MSYIDHFSVQLQTSHDILIIAHGDKAISRHCPVCMHVCCCQWKCRNRFSGGALLDQLEKLSQPCGLGLLPGAGCPTGQLPRGGPSSHNVCNIGESMLSVVMVRSAAPSQIVGALECSYRNTGLLTTLSNYTCCEHNVFDRICSSALEDPLSMFNAHQLGMFSSYFLGAILLRVMQPVNQK